MAVGRWFCVVRGLSIASRVLVAASALSFAVAPLSAVSLSQAGALEVSEPTDHGLNAHVFNVLGQVRRDEVVPKQSLLRAVESVLEDPFLNIQASDLLEDASLLHPDVVATVEVDLSELGSTAVELLEANRARHDAERRFEASLVERRRLSVEITLLRGDLTRAQSALVVAQFEEANSEQALADIAISTFMTLEESGLDGASPGISGSSFEAIASNSRWQLDTQLDSAANRRLSAQSQVELVSLELTETRADSAKQEFLGVQAEQDRVLAQGEIDSLQRGFERLLMTAEVVGTDIPLVVFDAYYRAALRIDVEQPQCEVDWSQLAGIGKVESSHGSFGGNVVGVGGRTDGEILGPVLDGLLFSEILDTDGGLLDGNVDFDRAVGPMQFIPGSWKIYGRDGNDDGIADPHNMYDAALAAGLHLCGSSSGLAEESSFTHALLGYNQSISYGVLVKAFAEDYEDVVGPVVVVPQEPDSVDVVGISTRIA